MSILFTGVVQGAARSTRKPQSQRRRRSAGGARQTTYTRGILSANDDDVSHGGHLKILSGARDKM